MIEIEEKDVLAAIGALYVENMRLKEAARKLLGENSWYEMALARMYALLEEYRGVSLPEEEYAFVNEVRKRLSDMNGGTASDIPEREPAGDAE